MWPGPLRCELGRFLVIAFRLGVIVFHEVRGAYVVVGRGPVWIPLERLEVIFPRERVILPARVDESDTVAGQGPALVCVGRARPRFNSAVLVFRKKCQTTLAVRRSRSQLFIFRF